MNAYKTLVYKSMNRVARIGLNRPEVLNAINSEMCFELRRAIDSAVADNHIRVIVLYGEGRCFSAGGDLKAKESASAGQTLDEVYKPALLSVFESTKPVIGAVHGPAIGVASALALACDLLVMADDAYLSEPFVGLGLIPDGGVSWHLVHQLGRKRAYECIVEGKKLSAVECVDIGFANRIAAADRFMTEAQSWAEELAAKPPLAMQYAKQALHAAMTMDLPDSMSVEAKLQNIVAESEDAKEGVDAFLQKRLPNYRGQ